MTLDEAIQHCEKEAEENEKRAGWYWGKADNPNYENYKNCVECAAEHRRLADWLKELKRYKNEEELIKIEVGDELISAENNKTTLVVTAIYEDESIFSGIDSNGDPYVKRRIQYWRKTGRYFPEIAQVFEKMKENE